MYAMLYCTVLYCTVRTERSTEQHSLLALGVLPRPIHTHEPHDLHHTNTTHTP